MTRCPWKIRWTFGSDAQCERDLHIDKVVIETHPDGRYDVTTIGDGLPDTHVHRFRAGVTELTWNAGDRREFTGDWPGPCDRGLRNGCTLHAGHHGRCAP